MTGITYKDTFFGNYSDLVYNFLDKQIYKWHSERIERFVNSLHRDESIHFHELVHIVQWERLGVENFLLAYGFALMQFGYRDSPLEQMAYSLQEDFDRESLPDGIIDLIQQRTDAVWADVARNFASLEGVNYEFSYLL